MVDVSRAYHKVGTLGHCSRCGQKHEHLAFKLMLIPIRQEVGHGEVLVWTHWASCPITGDPILMRMAESEEYVERTE